MHLARNNMMPNVPVPFGFKVNYPGQSVSQCVKRELPDVVVLTLSYVSRLNFKVYNIFEILDFPKNQVNSYI